MDEIVIPDVFAAAKTLRSINSFTRDDDTPLNYTLVNLKDWCKNHFEVINQLRINTDNSHHRYDVILLINGVPVVQIELKTLGVNPRRAMEQIVEYKQDPGNGYSPLHDSVKLITMHSSKGLEFPLVCIPAIGAPAKEEEDPQEEARLLYVAMTRATQELVMTHAETSTLAEKMQKAMSVLETL